MNVISSQHSTVQATGKTMANYVLQGHAHWLNLTSLSNREGEARCWTLLLSQRASFCWPSAPSTSMAPSVCSAQTAGYMMGKKKEQTQWPPSLSVKLTFLHSTASTPLLHVPTATIEDTQVVPSCKRSPHLHITFTYCS